MKKLFLLLMAVLSIGIMASAQTRTVTGTVVNADDDEPIIGVSVMPYGQSRGVQTDVDGNFSITVPTNVAKLTFSYVGMTTQTLDIPANNKMSVKLQNKDNVLDEVMVVAYGTTPKSAYTGSAAVVDASQLEDAMVSNVTNAFSGKMAGVQTLNSNGQPGSGSTVLIRGVGSINASTSPLYVVDGMPFSGDITTIATNDIESITVLKDAASTALYGARGANGVILVTTKKGSVGNARITVDMRWGSNKRAIPQYDVIDDPREYLEMAYKALYNTAIDYQGMTPAGAHQYINQNIWSILGYQTWTIPEGQDAFGTNGKFNPNATPGYVRGGYMFLADDWTKESLITGLRQEYQIGVQGGSEKLKYYISASYLEDEGIIKNSHFNRLSTRATIDYQAKSWLKIGANMSYTYQNTAYPDNQTNDSSTSSGNAFYFVNHLAPIFPFYVRNADGSIMINSTYGNKVYDYGDGKDYGHGMVGYTRMPSGNPIGQLTYDTTDILADVFDGKWYAAINPFKDFTVTANLSYHVDNTREHQVLNGVYGQFASFGGQAVQYQSRFRALEDNVLATYSKQLGEHYFDLLAGYEYENVQTEWLEALGSNLYDPTSIVVNNTIDNIRGYGAQSNLVHIGWLGRVNYNYANRYFLSGSIRRDGSSRFAPEHRWGTFWSASAGWRIDQEKFMHNLTWIDILKYKISFGQNGNDGIGVNGIAYADQYVMSGADGVFSDATLYYKGNREITWETSNSFNTGFDFAFWNGRLQGSAEYYSRQTSDMLFNIPTPPSLGYSSIPMNVGSMRNSGFEFDLSYTLLKNRNIIWDVNANITFQKNKIIKLDPSILNENGEWISDARIMREGDSMYQLYLTHYAGVNEKGQALYTELKIQTNEFGDVAYTNPAGQLVYVNAQNQVMPTDSEGNLMWTGEGDDKKPVISDEKFDAETFTKVQYENNTVSYLDAYNTNRKSTGNIMPKAYGGFGTSVKAYGFDLSVSFAYQFGGKIFDSSYQDFMQPGNALSEAWHRDMKNAWTPDNHTDIPALYNAAQYAYSNATSDRFLVSSNYLSLNNVTIGYSLPTKLLRKLMISNLRVYCAAENVALWSKRKGLDPRQGFVSSSNSTYSPIRTISGGIRVEF